MILVTGGTGLVGAHLLLRLTANGERVRAIYRNEASIAKTRALFDLYQNANRFENIEWVPADINEVPSLEPAFKGIDYVYHCAALISFDPKKEEQLRKTNIEGTANIVNFCLKNGIKKLCHVSSVAALGDLQDHETTITEETEWNPEKEHSDYAISKYGAEMEIWRGQQEGLEVVVVNPGIILGAGFWNDGSGKLFSAVANGLKFYTKGISGFVSVEDVIEAMVSLMQGQSNSERYILVGGNVSYEAISKTIASHLKIKQPGIYAPKWATEIAWRADWALSRAFFREQRISKSMAKSMHSVDIYSSEKIKKEAQIEFCPPLEYLEKVSLLFIS